MSNLDFERLLAAHKATLSKEYDEAEEYNDWMPDDGEYTVSVVKCPKGVSTKNDPNKPTFWYKPVVKIEAGDNPKDIGQEFSLGFFSTNNPGIMKSQARALNGGEPVPFDDVAKVFTESVGKILRVKVSTTTSTKNGKEYTNAYVQEVIQTEAVEDLPSEPPQGQEVCVPTDGQVEEIPS